jgi:dTMP kinase
VTTFPDACRGAAGRFIVLEGIDGSGTTTQCRALVALLSEAGITARFTCEPSTGRLGGLLRQVLSGASDDVSRDWDCMALLFAADRLDHVAREVRPALAQGITVICDRYDLSSLAYQSATSTAEASAVPWIRALNQRALRPDLTLVLDVDADVAESRRAERGAANELFERRELQRRLADIYASAEQLVPGDHLVHVNANATVDDVRDAILGAIARRFGS